MPYGNTKVVIRPLHKWLVPPENRIPTTLKTPGFPDKGDVPNLAHQGLAVERSAGSLIEPAATSKISPNRGCFGPTKAWQPKHSRDGTRSRNGCEKLDGLRRAGALRVAQTALERQRWAPVRRLSWSQPCMEPARSLKSGPPQASDLTALSHHVLLFQTLAIPTSRTRLWLA
jgi:hypothetical protein